ncbi:MAG: integrase arm-type DNA-binding domain-containing protein [Sphingomonadaceae bacterium]
MLTDAAIRKAKPRDKDYKLADSGGLHLFVTKTGHRSWRLKYRFAGKERRLVFGSYPEVSLAKARDMRDDAKRLLREGRDPAYETRKAKLANIERHEHTLETVAREWHELQKDRWTKVHANDVLTSLERDIFPMIGDLAISDIDEDIILTTLQAVENRGAIETAHRLRQRLNSVFSYAKPRKLVTSNPTNIGELLKPVPTRKRLPALVDLTEIRKLISAVDQAGASPVTRLASRFMALTAQRPGMIRTAPWKEFEGIDWEAAAPAEESAVWRIPASRMKQDLALREDDDFEHLVPLSRQAVDVLRTVHRLTGRGPLAFPGNRSSHSPMSENSVNYLYNRLGYQGRHVSHGWRSSFSTLMNEHFARQQVGADSRLMIERMIIDLMLAHIPSGLSEAERRYNRAAYIDRRREIAQLWADWIMEGQVDASSLLDGPRRPLKQR